MPYSGEQLRYLLALVRLSGMGPAKILNCMKTASDLSVFFDSAGKCALAEGIADWKAVDQDLQWSEKPGCTILCWAESGYPPLLKEIPQPPPVLFVQGDLALLSRPQIAMVGSRAPSPSGRETARHFARFFSEAGLTVTSGLALGIDDACHHGALEGPSSTIAVLGHGVDRVYPASQRALAHQISEQGALISEFPLGSPPIASHFPRRNRIISGLSVGTLVVEAALQSGSLITAKQALEQGREVFAIPGSIHNPVSKGCHQLIKQGAKLVDQAEDVLEELGSLVKYVTHHGSQKMDAPSPSPLNPTEETLLNQIGFECTQTDTLIARSGLAAAVVSPLLLSLELQGYIASVPGGYARLFIKEHRN